MGILDNTEHRPFPAPERRWKMVQNWHNLLFAHWPCSVDVLRTLVPEQITLDTFNGQAWVGIIVFRLTGVRLRGLPAIPAVANFPEINVRTYVTVNGKPGIYFFSLDADNPVGIMLAKPWFRLAYRHARIQFKMVGDEINFDSIRTEPGAPEARFSASYRPISEICIALPGTLEHWLTERYCYYSADPGGIYCGEVHHAPWPLQAACADIITNTMAQSNGINLPNSAPVLHYAHVMHALIWGVKRLTENTQAV